jgi:hypothetical protein
VKNRPVFRSGLLTCTVLFLLWLAWQALSGGFRQLHRSRTRGQKIETIVQIVCGISSILVVLTCFRSRSWEPAVRAIWGISLTTAAGLSSIVWGPPMPHIGVLFIAIALLVVQATSWALRAALPATLAEQNKSIDQSSVQKPIIINL